jgi:hypothetical protein
MGISVVDVLHTGKWTPQQALLEAQTTQDDMDQVAVVFIRKDEDIPRLIYSDMKPVDMNFLGLAVQLHSLKFMKE